MAETAGINQGTTSKAGVRHAEKRRNATCLFADRVAQVSVDHYKKVIPLWFRQKQKLNCISTIICHDKKTDRMKILGMGVGTKFLSNEKLAAETSSSYGDRIRDSHAEVLARRCFRRYLSLEILAETRGMDSDGILERVSNGSELLYRLRPDLTLHAYSSSSPCGNAVLKRFVTCRKEVFRDDLGPDEWPESNHQHIPGHMVSQGEFSLLVKADHSYQPTDDEKRSIETRKQHLLLPKQVSWSAITSTDWCPPGTSTVWTGKGSIHTCSDKICRWNFLGWQGALLSCFIADDANIGGGGRLLPSTFTVGRKLSAITCRRAVCCRVVGAKSLKRKWQGDCNATGASLQHHPTIMGTSIRLDDDAVVSTDQTTHGQEVRFHSSLSWAWWRVEPQNESLQAAASTNSVRVEFGYLECINGSQGWVVLPSWTTADATELSWDKGVATYKGKPVNGDLRFDEESVSKHVSSQISTSKLVQAFLLVQQSEGKESVERSNPETLAKVRQLKWNVSKVYETRKQGLLSDHEVFRTWVRRQMGGCETCTIASS